MRVAIEWKNPSHFLLNQPQASVEVLDGPEVPNPRVIKWPFFTSVPANVIAPVVASDHRWTFDLPFGAAWVSVEFSFRYSYGGTTYTLLRVLQLINMAQSVPIRWFPTITDPATQEAAARAAQAISTLDALSTGADRQHPLLTWRVSSAELTLTVASEFVDATDLWEGMHGQTDGAKNYKDHGQKENVLLALAYTGGSPLLWFTVVPPACKDSAGTVHAHVFFRPRGSTPLRDVPPGDVTGLTLPNQQIVGYDPKTKRPVLEWQYNIAWSTLNRYLLGSTMLQGCWPHQCAYDIDAGLGDSLLKSQKPVILFLPLTSDARHYGDAVTNKLPALLAAAFALIRSRNSVLPYVRRYQLASTFGISGYSQGGDPVLSVLATNSTAPIDSVFLFQPNELETQFAGPLARLAGLAKKLTVCVITQSLASPAVHSLKTQVESAGRGNQVKVVLMPDPAKSKFYRFFPAQGENDWIRYLFRKFLAPQPPTAQEKKDCPMAGHTFTDAEMKADLSSTGDTGTKWNDFLHQFVIIGGQVFPYKPETYDETPLKKAFFQECIEQSFSS